ncbi:MAG TPA: hypothetical protein DDY78_11210 [Planctomycetales bacterium]|nr:hypothetical protein [Planctomycetales bacterium]
MPIASAGKNAAFCAAVAALLLAPHLTSGPARVFSGDEPHYLLMLNSLLNDGDFDLANNYAAVHAGGNQAGEGYAALRTLDHHTQLVIDGRRVDWREFYDFVNGDWEADADGVVHPVPKPGVTAPPPGVSEYSTHQYGGAFLLAPLLYPLRDTTWLEPAAIFCSGLAVVGAMLCYRMLLRCFTDDAFTINAVTAVAFLGTPIWFYGRSLFLEGMLTCCVVGAYALALRKKWSFLPGILVGISIQMKPNLALAALPLFVDLLARREWRRAVTMALPVAASIGLLAWLYAELYGSPLRPPQPFLWGNFLEGASGLLLAPGVGLLIFCPIAVLAFFCWPAFVRTKGRDAALMGIGFVLFFLLMASYQIWNAGMCYGPRHLVPTLPLLLASLVMLPATAFYRSAIGKALTWGLAVVSILVNGFAVFFYWQFWGVNPYQRIATMLGFY